MNTDETDRNKSLEELEHDVWGEPDFEWHLVMKVHRLRRKPLNEFTTEDLRMMIGQEVGLPFLVPIAIERLEIDPLADGNFYRGDLLSNVCRINESFWTDQPGYRQRVVEIVRRARSLPDFEEVPLESVEFFVRFLNRSTSTK